MSLPAAGDGFRWRHHEGVPLLEHDLEGGARAAFTTRRGGVSEDGYASLNLGVLTGDARDAVIENRSRLARAVGLEPEAFVIGRQVHGAEIRAHEGRQEPAHFAEPGAPPPEVDGHHTTLAGLGLLVLVADCLPIALSGPGGIAMLHGGWRGIAAGIAERGARAVGARQAVIGPGIGPCCFEVGSEVLERFEGLGDDLARGRMLDLPGVARALLERAGVERIASSGLCTVCHRDLFFSHRADGPHTGRSAGVIWKPSA